jgi:hypothetical protein
MKKIEIISGIIALVTIVIMILNVNLITKSNNQSFVFHANIEALANENGAVSVSYNIKEEERKVETILLKGVTIKNFDPDIAVSRLIALHNTCLYTKSMWKDTLACVYKISNDSLISVRKFLNFGIGPYEMYNVFGNVYDKEAQELSFFENNGKLNRGYVVPIDSVGNIYNMSSWKIYNFNKINNYHFGEAFSYISDSLLLAVGGKFNNPVLLSIINLNDQKTVIDLPFWPDDGFDKNNFVKQSVYINNARIFKNKSMQKYLYVSGEGKYMEIFKINNNCQINDRIAIYKIFPEYKVQKDNMNYSIDPNFIHRGFRVFVTDSLIYAKPVEFTSKMLRTHETYKGYHCAYNDIINVFDWNGHFIKRYELDTPFNSFVVDEENKIIYTDSMDLDKGESIIKKYQIK